jgi:hypothetical protein
MSKARNCSVRRRKLVSKAINFSVRRKLEHEKVETSITSKKLTPLREKLLRPSEGIKELSTLCDADCKPSVAPSATSFSVSSP